MDSGRIDSELRGVHMGTLHGTIEGSLLLSPRLRTLDFLNRSTARFINIQDPRITNGRWHPGAAKSCVNASFVLWVAELTALHRPGSRRAAPLQSRSGIRLLMPDCEVLGFLHTPARGEPILRLNQDTNRFFALTSASVVGADVEFAAAFLAVNRTHVFAAEAFPDPEGDIGEAPEVGASLELAGEAKG